MADQKACDEYAAEMARRFDEFVRWARENWPVKQFPLMESDFVESRKELHDILGDRLGAALAGANVDPAAGGPQYVSMNPTPWP